MRSSQIPPLIVCGVGLTVSCSTPSGLRDPAPRADLIGFYPNSYLVMDRHEDGRRGLRAIDLPSGPQRPVATRPAGTIADAQQWARTEARDRGWIGGEALASTEIDGLRLSLRVRRPVGGRGDAAITATDGVATASILQLATGPHRRVKLGPIWRAPGGSHLVVAVDQGQRRSLHVVHLGRIRAQLYTSSFSSG